MPITILGTGALASLFAAHLSPLTPVLMIGSWREQIAETRRHGLILEDPEGRQTLSRPALVHASDVVNNFSLALVLVKSRQTGAAAGILRRCLAADGLAVTLQNGLGNLERLRAALGPNRVSLGITSHGATMQAPGVVHHAGTGPTYLASIKEAAARISALADLLNKAGIKTEIADNVDALLWGKLVVNSSINPLTALLGVTNGFLAENPAARHLMALTARETAAVAQALGVELPFQDAARQALRVATATASNHSSMLQDLKRGELTEIDAICGAVVQFGHQVGIATPINTSLLELIHEREARPVGPEPGNPGAKLRAIEHRLAQESN